jgi:hypothetical protein
METGAERRKGRAFINLACSKTGEKVKMRSRQQRDNIFCKIQTIFDMTKNCAWQQPFKEARPFFGQKAIADIGL